MKTQLCLATFFVALLAPSVSALAKRERAFNDWLIPPEGIIQADYYALIKRKLFLTPGNYGRVVDIEPALTAEAVTAIYSVGSQTRVTRTTASEKLWVVGSDSQYRFTKDPQVRVSRLDVPIEPATALAVSSALTRLTSQLRPPARTNDVVLDEPIIEFSTGGPGQIHRGILSPLARGRNIDGLRQLVALLKNYCIAPRADRPRLEQQIVRVAKSLGARTA